MRNLEKKNLKEAKQIGCVIKQNFFIVPSKQKKVIVPFACFLGYKIKLNFK